jgi:hypothetical protein
MALNYLLTFNYQWKEVSPAFLKCLNLKIQLKDKNKILASFSHFIRVIFNVSICLGLNYDCILLSICYSVLTHFKGMKLATCY